MAVLPDWVGRPSLPRERVGNEVVEQTTELASSARGDRQANFIRVVQHRNADRPLFVSLNTRAVDPQQIAKPTEAGIRSEIVEHFPDTDMQVVTRPAANAYGPYGLAIGRTRGGTRCLYAWQWIDHLGQSKESADREGAPSSVSLRVRLCRSDITFEAMAAAIDRIRLVHRREGTPFLRPNQPVFAASQPPRQPRQRINRSRLEMPTTPPRQPIANVAMNEPRQRYLASDTLLPEPSRAERSKPATFPAPATPGMPTGLGTFRSAAAAPSAIAADLPMEAFRGPSKPNAAATRN
ncbi:cellulose biosynthesis protein BcsN [Methylobacterium iners]|nr:cellulose biosynthesis protein BcsN [Methylobacterium iners]